MCLCIVAPVSNHFPVCNMLIHKAPGRLISPHPLFSVEDTETLRTSMSEISTEASKRRVIWWLSASEGSELAYRKY